ncbi:non-ribosomal peptide synthetase [Amycolatopsis benzoatilytica]|uniref:non-ribosomal peptide synthetase n=1 Tax=Amycolatopsis benzoatilytica TaxID=346045 RepID=UPI0003AB3E9C|nr:non-ribosomal peptide synthetase [Amycolatopsis benzoatilytica]
MTLLPQRVLAHARQRPDAVAVRQWDRRLTYGELATAATGLAAVLRARGVGLETPVGLCQRRTPDLIVGLLGIMLAGGVYLPLELSHPRHRRDAILADARPKLVLVDAHGEEALAHHSIPRLRQEGAGKASPVEIAPGNLACLMYTSGSTGEPKGVALGHGGLAAHLDAAAEWVGLDPDARVSAFASCGFDLSLHEIGVALAFGAEVALISEADRLDPVRLHEFLRAHEVSYANLPVSLLPLVEPHGLPALTVLGTGSEAPGPEQVARWTGPGRRFLNSYGPTEATVMVSSFDARGEWTRPIPIGGALGEHGLHVVDERLRLVPAGTPGELLISGAGLARGYLGRPGLTAQRFIADPFGSGGRAYRTGDLVRRTGSGDLEFLGRLDRQVKIRGQRVELGEIETALRAHPGVRHAVVDTVRGAVVAFCVPETVEPSALREYCAGRLPAAMVPTRVFCLPEFPLLASHKVDLSRLRELAAAGPGPVGAPDEPLPAAVARVWQRMLGVGEDFFDAGGHSLTAMTMTAALRAEVGRDVGVGDIYRGRTLAGLIERVERAARTDEIELTTGHPPELSPGQRRLWFLDRLAPGSAAYNTPLARRLRGPVDPVRLQAALNAVLARHEVLRWRFPADGGLPRAVADPPSALPLPVVDLSADQLQPELDAEATAPFDLASGPLVRAKLLRLAPDDHVLAITFHHAVFDGWSLQPFCRDLSAAYTGELAPLPVGYADYPAWRSERDRRRSAEDLAWWREHLSDAPTVLDLPRDHSRPSAQAHRGALVRGRLDPEVSAAVEELAANLDTTSSVVLFAAFAELLHGVTGRDDLVLGTPVADRGHVAFHDLVGFFVEIAPLRCRADDARSFADTVRGAAAEFVAALAHPAAPLERIIAELRVPRESTRGPLVQVLFNVYGFAPGELVLPGVATETLPAGQPGSAFDLTVYVERHADGFGVELLYDPALYESDRIDRLLAAYLEWIAALTATGEKPPLDPMLSRGIREIPATQLPEADHGAWSDTERELVRMWAEVLDGRTAGISDNFFDLGGTSFALIVLHGRIERRWGSRARLVDLFRYPTVRAFAAFLDGQAADTALEAADRRARARRTRAQTRGGRSWASR